MDQELTDLTQRSTGSPILQAPGNLGVSPNWTMKTLKKPQKPPGLSDIVSIAGYVFIFAGLLFILETLLAVGRTQYPGRVPPSGGVVPVRYLIYAFESSLFFRYALLLVLLGAIIVFIDYILRFRTKKHGRTD